MTPTHKPEDGDRAPISNRGAERASLPKSVACLWVTDNPKHCSLLRPAPNVVNAFPWPADSKTEEDRNYWRERGFWQEPLFTAEQMYDYANTDATALLAEKVQRIERLEAALRECLDDLEYLAKAPDSAYARPDDSTLELARAALSHPHPHGG